MKKIAIVTGSSKGIGEGICTSFLQDENYLVIGVSRSSNPKLKQQANYQELLLNLFEEQSIKKITEEIKKLTNNTKTEICFIHNFGFSETADIYETSKESFEKTIYANATLPFLLTQAISPLMKEGSSHQFIGSTLSTMAVPSSTAYVTSKHAVLGLMRSCAVDLAKFGIRCNLICPGFTETEMANNVIKSNAEKNNMSFEELKNFHINNFPEPLKRFIKAEEIGNFVKFLADNPSISGEIYHVHGGYGLTC